MNAGAAGAAGGALAAAPRVALSIKVPPWGKRVLRDVARRDDGAAQAITGVPVTTRQVAKRWSRVWR